ncbi:MAG: CHC2 zinc finger domain-containing protein, partial [Desulfobacteraceae bacterium]|nr:CHC2 zinc finger domain-containing protein [Desulfobacteraceae bacterium]
MARPADEGVVQAVKEAVDIVQVVGEVVNLRRTGANYLGLCPFHGEKTPSFTVSPARKFFHCFGCGESGDVLTFVMRHQNLPFWEALKQLAGRYHIPLPERELSHQEREADNRRQELYLVNQRAADLYHDLLLNDPRAALAREYLAKRRIPPEIITRFRLGYAPERWDFLSKALPDTPPELLVEAGLIVARDSGGGFYDRFRQRVLF